MGFLISHTLSVNHTASILKGKFMCTRHHIMNVSREKIIQLVLWQHFLRAHRSHADISTCWHRRHPLLLTATHTSKQMKGAKLFYPMQGMLFWCNQTSKQANVHMASNREEMSYLLTPCSWTCGKWSSNTLSLEDWFCASHINTKPTHAHSPCRCTKHEALVV